MTVASKHSKRLSLAALAWPLFIEQGSRVLIGTVDTLMVSHISDGAVAAVGVAMQVVYLAISTFGFIGVGASVVITHHIGAGNRGGATEAAKAAIGVSSWIGLLVSGLVASLAGPLLGLLQLPPALFPYAQPFLTLMGGTLFLESQNIAAAAVLRANGNTRGVMFVTGLQNLVNVAGNAVVLFGLFGVPRLGVLGVALSGVGSRLICFLVLRLLVRRSAGVQLGVRDYFAFPVEPIRKILHIGLPAAGEIASHWLAFMTVTSFSSRLGQTQLATVTYSYQVIVWVFLFTNSIAVATEILVGHLIGAGEFDRAYRLVFRSLRNGMLCAAAVSGGLALAAPQVLGMFTEDPSIIASGVVLLQLGVPLEIGRVLNVVVINGLRATGDARFPLVIGIFSVWGVWVPLAWVLAFHYQLGLPGIWIAMIVDEWLRGLVVYARWWKRTWVEHAERSRAHVAVTADAVAE